MKKLKYNEKDTIDFILEWGLIFSVICFIYLMALLSTIILSFFLPIIDFKLTTNIFYGVYILFIVFINFIINE